MSTFQELSQAIGTQIHKATKEANGTAKQRTVQVVADPDVIRSIRELVNHTIQNTGDNE